MQTITRTRWVPFTPPAVYGVLTTPDKLVQVVKRLLSVAVLEQNETAGSARVTVDLPGGKVIETQGRVEGETDHRLAFIADQPFPLQIMFELFPEKRDQLAGTTVSYSIGVDFSPVIELLSTLVLEGYLSSEMDDDLARLEELLAEEVTPA